MRQTFAARDAVTGRLVGGCELRLQADGSAHVSYWTSAGTDADAADHVAGARTKRPRRFGWRPATSTEDGVSLAR